MGTSFHASTVRGSIFAMIFIAIGLFAALSYALFHGGQVGEQSLTKEQSKLAAQEIIAYGDALANAVQTLRLRGCADTQFDFANTAWVFVSGSYLHPVGHNPSAPATGCSIFTIDGNLKAYVFNTSYFDTSISLTPASTSFGSSHIRKLGLPGVGTSSADMAYVAPHIKNDVCIEINKILGINSNNYLPSHTITGAGSTLYNGNYTTSLTMTHDVTGMDGKAAFCSLQTGASNRYYKTLIAR